MPLKKKSSGQTETNGSLSAALAALSDESSPADPTGLDASLLWMSVVSLLNSGGALQVGMTRDRSAFTITVYGGEFPYKQVAGDADRANHILAAVVRAILAKHVPAEWEQHLQKFFP